MACAMSYRNRAIGTALILTMALAACGERGGGKKAEVEATPTSVVEAAADPCGSVGGAFGEALCGDPDLSPLVGEVKSRLVEAAGAIPLDAARQLANGQAEWLQATRVSCGIGEGKIPLTAEQEGCLAGALRRRAEQASSAVTQKGGYTFQAVELNRAQPIAAEVAAELGGGEYAPVAITQEIRFPRLQGDSPQIRRFNELMTQRPQYVLTDQTSEFVDYRIAYAGPELISVRFTTMDMTASAARPNNGEKVVTVVMSTGEPLKEEDVFSAPPARWKAWLAQRVSRDLRRQFNAMDPGIELRAPEVLDTATKTKNWLITEEALVVLFPPESIGPHALGNFEVKIPWSEMKALLNPNAPAPIKA